MAITTLAGTKWTFKTSGMNIYDMVESMECTHKNINFTSNNMSFTQIIFDALDETTYFIGSSTAEPYMYGIGFGNSTTGLDTINRQHNAVWTDDSPSYWLFDFKTIEIIDGADVTDASLIAWLEAHADQIIEPTIPPLSIGTKNITDGYVGNKRVVSMYLGNIKIYEASEG